MPASDSPLRFSVVGKLADWQQAAVDEATNAGLLRQADDEVDFVLSADGPSTSDTQFGTWWFQADDVFWALARGERTVAMSLYRQIDDRTERIYSGSVRLIPHSAEESAALAQAVSREFLAKACRDIAAGTTSWPAAEPPTSPTPSLGAKLRYRLRTLKGKLDDKLDYLFRHTQWGVGVVHQPIQTLLDADTCPPAEWIPNRDRERFIADPAGRREGDGSYGIFVEDLEQRAFRGKVTYYNYRPGQGFDGPKDVLTEGHHLSYPYLIEHDGRVFCVPESAAAESVQLYELTDYPGGWQPVAKLLDIPALDSTIFQHENRWWLLAATRVASGAYSLVAYYADDLFGPWRPHARNPLSTDIATARPGGQPFVSGGALIRPAQDCSRTYGGALALMRVETLTPTEFVETLLRVVEPDPASPYNEGFHTAYPVGDITLVDGKRRVFIPYVFKKALGLT